MKKDNSHIDIDPYGEEIWENEQLYGINFLESIRGQWPDIDMITDRILRREQRTTEWHNFPWWKKIFTNRLIYIYKD